MSENGNVIQVVLAVYDPKGTYSRNAGVVMTSLFSNTQSKVNVTILHDSTLTDDNRRRFERTAERWNQSVNFIDVSEHIFRIAEDPDKITHILSRGALFRLLIPNLLDTSKIIYLDCDIIVNLDIADLWTTSMEDFALLAIKDQSFPVFFNNTYHEKIRIWVLRYVSETYFNSGVLVMDLNRVRSKYNMLQDGFEFFIRYSHVADWADQDFLNVAFCKDVFLIEERFNRMLNCDNVDNAILHFAGSQPWKIPHDTQRDRLFWRIIMESEWSDDFMGAIIELSRNNPLSSYRTLDCFKLLLSRFPRYLHIHLNVGACVNLGKDFLIILKELAYRIRKREFKKLRRTNKT